MSVARGVPLWRQGDLPQAVRHKFANPSFVVSAVSERLLAQAEVPRRLGSFGGGALSRPHQTMGISVSAWMGRKRPGHKRVAPQK
jgi:hypothetical protein